MWCDALSSVCERPLGKEEAVKWGFTMYGQPDSRSHALCLFLPVSLETKTDASNTPTYIHIRYTQAVKMSTVCKANINAFKNFSSIRLFLKLVSEYLISQHAAKIHLYL